jgi:hypothetical protein
VDSSQSDGGNVESSPIPASLRGGLVELEAFLVGEPPEKLSGHVLVLASAWVLGDTGLDLGRLSREAKTFRDMTPEHDRVLASFPDALASYLVYRMMTDEEEQFEPEVAESRLEQARAALELRAEWTAADYPLVAEGFRRLLAETAYGKPPYDPLWHALARRIGDPGLPDWQVRAAR